MLIHRSLENIRNGRCFCEMGRKAGGSRVKCLLAVASGVCLCCAAMLLLAQVYSAYLLESTQGSEQRRARPLPSHSLAKADRSMAHAASVPAPSPRTQKVSPKFFESSGKKFEKSDTGQQAFIPRSRPSPDSTRTPEPIRRLPGKEEKQRKASAAEYVQDWPDGGQQSLDRHFAFQARKNERVLELEQNLQNALSRGDSVQAKKTLRKLLAIIGGQSRSGLKWRGFCALGRGDWIAAEKYYSRALAASPRDIQCRYNLAFAQLKQGRKDAAALNYLRLKALAPRSGEVRLLAPYFEPQ